MTQSARIGGSFLVFLFAIAPATGQGPSIQDRLRPSPEPIPAYSESLAPAYEGVWPSGRVHPLYAESLRRLDRHPAPEAALARLRAESGEPAVEPLPRPVRRSDFTGALEPGLAALVESVRRTTAASGALVLGITATVEIPELTRRWVIQGLHTPPAESILRPWLLARAMGRSFPRLAVSPATVSPARFVEWLRSLRHPGDSGSGVAIHLASGPAHPAWRALEAAGARPFDRVEALDAGGGRLSLNGRSISIVYHERPAELAGHSGLKRAFESGSALLVPSSAQERATGWGARHLGALPGAGDGTKVELVLPQIRAFADGEGQLVRDVYESIFREETPSPYEKWQARSTWFRDPAGRLVLDGRTATRGGIARLALAVRAHPADFLAHEFHRPTRLGDRQLYHHVVALAAPGRPPVVTSPGAAQTVGAGSDASWLPAVLVGDGDPAAAVREDHAARPIAVGALEAARRFDAARYEAVTRYLAGETAQRASGSRAAGAGFMHSGSPAGLPRLSNDESAGVADESTIAGPALTNRANGLPDHQLEATLAYLSGEYRRVGLEPVPFRFEDGGRSWANLAVDIRGRTTEVVIVADHFDTAIDDATIDGFSRKGWRAAPGADDNASGTAALVEYGRILSRVDDGPPLRTIRLLHLTGEEFPTDCLGARRYAEHCLRRGERIAAVIVLDMIGFRDDPGAGIFQLSEGEAVESGALTGRALAACRALAAAGYPVPEARVCPRFDAESYLYNTDGVIFSDVGMPTLLFNEHLNKFRGLDRTGYHDRWDTPARMDFRYAAAVARVALMTAMAIAGES